MNKNRKTVLQATMGLDIGGAETHIVELSIELKRRGYRVIVASNGGVYEDILKENGVETVKVPMNTRNIKNMFKSYIALKKLIKKENIAIVHSHARIPSLMVSLLKRSIKFSHITTAHGVFKVNKLLKFLTSWGDESIVVSEDIKKYLIKEYNFPEDKIHMNINGINLERFKKRGSVEKRENIVHISRLESDTSKVAYCLLEYGRENSDRKILIVGDGSELESLKRKADGLENVLFAGKSPDVTKYLEKGFIFVGISRAALEAMCYNIPIVLAGDYGYMGVLGKNKIEKAERNNFTARNSEKLNCEVLSRDIDYLISSLEKEDFSWYRGYVSEKYSVSKMVDNYESVYFKYI